MLFAKKMSRLVCMPCLVPQRRPVLGVAAEGCLLMNMQRHMQSQSSMGKAPGDELGLWDHRLRDRKDVGLFQSSKVGQPKVAGCGYEMFSFGKKCLETMEIQFLRLTLRMTGCASRNRFHDCGEGTGASMTFWPTLFSGADAICYWRERRFYTKSLSTSAVSKKA